MPSCYSLLLHLHDRHQKSFCELQVLFREVLCLDCNLTGGYTLKSSCHNLLPHRHDLHQKSFCELSQLSREVLWLDCILPACCTLMQVVITCCYSGMIVTINLFAYYQCFFVKFFGLIVFSQVVVH